MKVIRALVIGLATVAAAGLVAALVAGVLEGTSLLLGIFLVCVLAGVIGLLLPATFRTRVAPFLGVFVAAAGLVPTFIPEGDPPPERDVNADYLARLVREGPFTGSLPGPLEPAGLGPVNIGDPSAAARVDATQLRVEMDLDEVDEYGEITAFAHMEIYPSPKDAARRGTAALASFATRYGRENVSGACADVPPAAWTCIGTRGHAYAEVTLTPSPNAFLPLATGSVAALLRYTDRLSRQAS